MTVREVIGMMKRLTTVARPKAVRKPSNNCLISASPALIVGNKGPYVKATLVKILYIMTGNWSAGTLARNVLTNQMLANSQIAQTLWDNQQRYKTIQD